MRVLGVIPSRYGSTRFPGKPLVNILGKSMIQRVHEQCNKSSKLTDLIVATDDQRIYNHVVNFGGRAMITSKKHKTGTERCNQVIEDLNEKFDIIVNIQGDEPFINPVQIDKVIDLFNDESTQIGTLAKKIEDMNILEDQNSPKAIFDKNANAITFCRKISNISAKSKYYKHIGIYAYKKDVLKRISQLPESKNEIKEQLEQLRWLDNNYNIKIGITMLETTSIDVPEDIEKIKQKMR